MSINYLFYLVFLSQIILISYYIPKRIKERMRYVLENYPEKDYPKLYVDTQAKAENGYRNYVILQSIILAIGVLIFVGLLYDGSIINQKGGIIVSAIYGLIQAIPIVLMDFMCMRHYKKMREDDERTTRKADLKPRVLFDYISPLSLGFAVVLMLVAMLTDMYLEGFDFSKGVELFEGSMVLFFTNLFFVLMVRWRVYGKKLDPYQDSKDRVNEVSLVVKSAVFTSICLSSFIMGMKAISVYELDMLKGVMISIYFQAIIGVSVLYSLGQVDVKKVNFDVYKGKSTN